MLNRIKRIKQFILGKPLPTHEVPHQTIGKSVGLAVFASDVLSSSAYATEEIFIILAMAGVAYLGFSLPIAFAIILLLIILTISYRQTIFAYPGGGGAYIVAKENLGEHAAQTAGAALLTDYILTVAVSISAGVAQLASAFPFLLPWRVHLAVAMIIFIMIMNLRGVKESGRFFAVPVYFFVCTMFMMLGVGFYKLITGTLSEVSGVEYIQAAIQPLTLFLILRAFSSGCAALTGTEAVSNGITAFREPKSRNAATVMVWMSGILGTMFLGVTFLASKIHAMPLENETVISQLARTIFGIGPFHILVLAVTTLILILAANTSYADFPRLAALHAGDGFLPRHFVRRGSRLVFAFGIVTLSVFAAFLVIIFQANVTRLIPLYAIGVFLSFTLSQSGMVRRWQRIGSLKKGEKIETKSSMLTYDPRWRRKQAISAVGAAATFIVMLVFAITKFASGAWIVVILIPTLVLIFFSIHRHYKSVAKQLSLVNPLPQIPPEKTVVILVGDVHIGTLRAVEVAKTLHAAHLKAVHIAFDADAGVLVEKKWKQYVEGIPIDIIISPYRELIGPLTQYIKGVERKWEHDTVIVVIPEFIPTKFWHHFLHNQTAMQIHWAFEHHKDVVVLDVPYRLK